nr:hypothetical protein Q903MT_gene3032 [Picea sitchensis]
MHNYIYNSSIGEGLTLSTRIGLISSFKSPKQIERLIGWGSILFSILRLCNYVYNNLKSLKNDYNNLKSLKND